MKKRLLSVFLCLCMVFSLVPATVWAETTNGHTHYLCGGSTCNGSGHENETYKTTFEKEIKQEGNTLKIGDKSWAPTKGSNDTFYILPTGTYYLGSDISLEYTIKIENNVTLCLNGHKITAADGMDAIYMTGGSITLTDCKGVGTITHASSKTGRGVYVSSGTFNMYGGSITGNKAQDAQGRGGGVYVYSGSGTFNMYGGSITGNRATGDGGGVYKSGSNSSFNMYGGSITGNTANSYGGGVYVDGGGFTMSGGTIGGTKTGETNTATYGGGGVYVVGSSSTFEMTDGSITGDTKNNVYLPTGKTITIGTDKLSEGAQLGVTVSGDYGDYPFTSGWNANMSDKTPSDYFISDTDGYVAKLNGSELKMVTHVHNWTYTASGDTITATCKNCSNNNGNDFSGGSVTIQKPEKTKFNDGKDENAKVESVGWFGKAPSVAYAVKDGNALSAAPVNAGTYTAGITLGNVTVSVTYIIDKATQTAPTGLTTKGDIKNSGTGEIKNTAEDMEYNISANATTGWITCDNGSTRVAPGTYYVRYKETDNYLASAVSAALTVKAHTHSGGNATCQKKAVCDGCGQEYGELGNHKFTETVSKMYLNRLRPAKAPQYITKAALFVMKNPPRHLNTVRRIFQIISAIHI